MCAFAIYSDEPGAVKRLVTRREQLHLGDAEIFDPAMNMSPAAAATARARSGDPGLARGASSFEVINVSAS